jgi:hypothetical protein
VVGANSSVESKNIIVVVRVRSHLKLSRPAAGGCTKTLSENHMIEHEHQSEQYDIILKMSSYNLQHHTWMCGQMWRIYRGMNDPSSAARSIEEIRIKICIRKE